MRTHRVLLPIILFAGLLASGQTAPTVEEPEALGKIFLLDSAKQLRELPVETWRRETKGNFGTIKYVNVVSGKRSSFRVSSSDKIVFVYKPFTSKAETFDPVQAIQLFAFDVGNKDRTCVIRSIKGKTDESNQGIQLDVVKYGTSSYTLTPSGSHLAPGEYWIHTPGVANHPVTTFGVD